MIGRLLSIVDEDVNQAASVISCNVDSRRSLKHWDIMKPIDEHSVHDNFQISTFLESVTKQMERVELYESCLPENFQPKTEMSSLEKWAMVELLNVIENVHKMAQKGDFRNLGIILVQF